MSLPPLPPEVRKQSKATRAVRCQEPWHFYLPSLLETWYMKVVNK